MLTNILVTVAIIMIVIDFYVMFRLFKYIVSSNKEIKNKIISNQHVVVDTYNKFVDLDNATVKNFNGLSNKLGDNKELLITIRKDYFDRLEAQEKLIAELKAHQAPEEVVETVSLINEWLTGNEE